MVAAKDFILVDGQRYAYDRDSFRAFSLPLDIPDLKAKRRLAPFVSAELVGFQGGIASTLLDDEGTTVSALLGFEPDVDSAGSATASLRVAHQLQAAHSAAGSGILLPLVADRGYALAGEQGSDRVLHSSDGVTWTPVSTGGSGTNVTALAAMDGVAWAGFNNSLVYLSADGGSSWAQTMDITSVALPDGNIAGGAQAASCSVILPDPIHPVQFPYTQYVYYVGENYAGHGTTAPERNAILCWQLNFTTSGVTHGLCLFNEPFCKAGIIHEGDIWVCTAETAGPVHGVIYRRPTQTDVNPGAGTAPYVPPVRVATIDGDYAVGVAAWRGKTYWGTNNGAVYVCDGSTAELVRTFPTTRPIRGLAAWRGSLYVAIYNDSANRLEVWRLDSDGRWTVPHSAGATLDAAGQLISFTDTLYVASGQSTTGKVYRVSATDRNTAAAFDTPDIALGAPTLPKRWRRFAAQHAALGIGQSVALSYSTDGGSTWGGTITNYDVGATESAVELGDGVLAPLARFRVAYAGGTADAFTVRSAVADALPAPDAREVWTADLRLRPRNNGAWADGTADTTDALAKHRTLKALKGETFQVVSPLHGSAGYPDRAMLASLDPQVPLEWRMVEAHPGGQSDVELIVPVRLVQAAEPSNLLDNAGFERGTAGWTQFGTAASAGTVNFWHEDGTASLQLHFNGTSTVAEMFQLTTGNAVGRYHTLSGWLWQEMGGGRVQLVASAAGTPIPGGTALDLGAGTSSAWVRYEAAFLLPDWTGGTITVECRGYQFPNGTAYFDALLLEERAPASAYRERGA